MRMRLRPKGGREVPLPPPHVGNLAREGEEVEYPGPEQYWARRLADGMVEVVPEPVTESDEAIVPRKKKKMGGD